MVKCPFCQFDNEDGALFCEQCKSDLAEVPVAAHAPAHHAAVAAQPVAPPPPPVAEPVTHPVVVPVAEAVPVLAEPIELHPSAALEVATPMPVAAPEVIPPIEPRPVVAVPMASEPHIPPAPEVPAPPPPAPPPAPAPAASAPAAETPATVSGLLPPGSQPRLLVLRGQKRNVEYPIYEGLNFIGRADDKPVDIDLEDQEPPDRIWCSRQHCCISFESDKLEIEDLNSANGTFVNRQKIYPGQKRALQVGDIVQIGNVQMRVLV